MVFGPGLMTGAWAQTPKDLFFSEYVEGSSNNKALEIYNGTGSTIDLNAGNYVITMHFNGSTTAGLTITLSGTIANGGVFILAQSSANASVTLPEYFCKSLIKSKLNINPFGKGSYPIDP